MPLPRTISCPVCGKAVPAQASACHHCGACDKTGWNAKATATDGLDLPDDSFDDEKFTQEEFGTPRRRKGKTLVWRITAAILLIVTTVLIFMNALFR
jgi:predicted nucleic acid-binding Zn ribbon protein